MSAITEQPTVPPYPGMRWVYHRLTKAKEYMHDFKTLAFGAGEYQMLPQLQAEWLLDHNRVREYPARWDDPDPVVRASAIEYAFALDGDAMFGVPLTLGEHEEYLSREGQSMYLQRGSDVKTTPKLIRVGEVTGPVQVAAPPAPAVPTADVLALAQQMARQMMDEFLKAQPQHPARMSGRRPPKRRARTTAPLDSPAVPTDP
jgi:hypothetical protein